MKVSAMKAAVLVFGLVLSFSNVAAYAHNGHDQREESFSARKNSRVSDNTPANSNSEGRRKQFGENARQRGQEFINEARKRQKNPRSLEARTLACQNRQVSLETKLDGITQHTTLYQTRYDQLLEAAIDYHLAHHPDMADWDTMLANTRSKQEIARVSSDALQGLTPFIDCTNLQATQETIASFRAAVEQTRNDLRAYKQSLKDLLVAIKEEKAHEQ